MTNSDRVRDTSAVGWKTQPEALARGVASGAGVEDNACHSRLPVPSHLGNATDEKA